MSTTMSSRRAVAHRVARRHLFGNLIAELHDDEDFAVVYSDGGVITGDDIVRLLEDRKGRSISVVFRTGEVAPGNTVWWDGVTATDERISVSRSATTSGRGLRGRRPHGRRGAEDGRGGSARESGGDRGHGQRVGVSDVQLCVLREHSVWQ